MFKLLLPLVAVLAVGSSAAGAYFWLTSEGRVEEAVVSQPTPTPVPTGAPTPTLSPVPADWATYTDPGGLFTVRYPPTWFQSEGRFSSYDVSTLTTVRRPPEAVAVEVWYGEAAGLSGCGGALDRVPGTTGSGRQQDFVLAPGTTPATLGGLPAWQLVREVGDPAIAEEDLTRIHGISLIYNGYCFLIAAYYTQQNPDVATFETIVSSFTFTK